MRRTKRGEQSAFSLFPFLAVLLCTMGAMVVLLVAMAHVSRAKASREAELAQAAVAAQRAAAENSAELQAAEEAFAEAQRLTEAARLLREESDRLLADEQLRLSGIEDHLRRLTDEVEELTVETRELVRVEEEHYDDERIAKQELERLNALIGQLEDEIEQLKHAAAGRERKYAVVPLRDRTTGTIRPPVYYECDAEGIVLQPEGIRLSPEDLVSPEFSSPVAAASRAVTRYYEEHPEIRAANEAGAPYALLIVRPDGVASYGRAKAALEGAGLDYGYQPVGADWPIDYEESNPVLAQWVDDAVRLARKERRGLARVVPRLAARLARVDNARNAGPAGGLSTTGASTNRGAGIRVSRSNPDANNPFEGLRIEGSLPGEGRRDAGNGGPQPTGPSESVGQAGAAGAAPPAGNRLDDNLRPNANLAAGAAGQSGQPPLANANSPTGQGQAGQGQAAQGQGQGGQQTQQSGQAAQNTLASNPAAGQAGGSPGGSAGGRGRGPQRRGVPIVRPIRLYVSKEQVAVLPDRAQTPADAGAAFSESQSVNFTDLTSAQINELIDVLKRHADSWGIAGQGLYWDPRLVLNVTTDGAQRADEVRQLLEAAGLKVQAYPVATAAQPGGNRATR